MERLIRSWVARQEPRTLRVVAEIRRHVSPDWNALQNDVYHLTWFDFGSLLDWSSFHCDAMSTGIKSEKISYLDSSAAFFANKTN